VSKNVEKRRKRCPKFSLFSTLKLLTDTFAVNQLHICYVIQTTYIKTVHFLLKYNGLAIVRKTTKLIEGSHRGVSTIGLLLLRFFTFFKIQKVVTFYVFCRVSYVFSNYILV